MSKYYYLISGLPNISLDDSKLAYSVSSFKTEVEGMLTSTDKKLINLFYLKYDNENLLAYLKWPDRDPDPRGRISYEEFNALYKALKEEEKPPRNKNIPSYFVDFMNIYLAEQAKDEKTEKDRIAWEDRLAALYYEYAMGCGNAFVSAWFELNLNINNVLAALICRKYGLEKSDYIVGQNEVAEALRSSNARDFGLGDSMEYLPELQRLAEEPDLLLREKKLDALKWQWLDDHTFFKPFDIESVFAYLVKLEMIGRWITLDKTTGEKTFRELVGAMKKGGENVLEEFKRNNNK